MRGRDHLFLFPFPKRRPSTPAHNDAPKPGPGGVFARSRGADYPMPAAPNVGQTVSLHGNRVCMRVSLCHSARITLWVTGVSGAAATRELRHNACRSCHGGLEISRDTCTAPPLRRPSVYQSCFVTVATANRDRKMTVCTTARAKLTGALRWR